MKAIVTLTVQMVVERTKTTADISSREIAELSTQAETELCDLLQENDIQANVKGFKVVKVADEDNIVFE